MPSTIYEVAEKAGVSIASVSLVIANPDTKRVGTETRKRILKVADAVGYTPSAVAKALFTGNTNIMGLVVPMHEPIFKNPFIADVLTGIQSTAMEHGYHLMIYTHKAATGRLTASELNHSRFVDGIIAVNTRICSSDDMTATIRELRASRTRFVMVNGYYGAESIPYVGFDDGAAAEIALKHLLMAGHKSVALFGGSSRSPVTAHLFETSRAVAKRLHFQRFRHAATEYDGEKILATLRLWKKEVAAPTAIFCADEHVAAKLYETVASLGWIIPNDLSVVAMGNSQFARSLQPPLTSVSVPAFEIGQTAAALLIEQFKGGLATKRVVLSSGAIEGRSVSTLVRRSRASS